MTNLIKEGFKKPKEIIPFIIMKLNGIKMRFTKNSIFTLEKELSMCSLQPKNMIDEIIRIYHPNSIIDIGCGSGKAMDYFLQKGVEEVKGIEGSKMAIKHSKYPKLIIPHNLNKEINLNKKFDLLYSFEFIEHIHPKYVNQVLRTFSNHSNIIVMTAASPGAHGQGHFNCKDQQYWVKKFRKYDYKLNQKNTQRLKNCGDIFSDNILVFERK